MFRITDFVRSIYYKLVHSKKPPKWVDEMLSTVIDRKGVSYAEVAFDPQVVTFRVWYVDYRDDVVKLMQIVALSFEETVIEAHRLLDFYTKEPQNE